MKRLSIFLLLVSLASAADYKQAKILDVQPYQAQNNSLAARWARIDGGSLLVRDAVTMVAVDVSLDDLKYTVVFPERQYMKSGELIIGDMLPVRVDGENMIIKTPKGKENKGRIVRRARQ